MKLTESKLRSIIREEVSKLDETRLRRATDKYSRVSNEASEKAKERPAIARDHIRAMINVSQELVIQMEYSDKVPMDRLEELREALIDAEVAVQLLFEEMQ